MDSLEINQRPKHPVESESGLISYVWFAFNNIIFVQDCKNRISQNVSHKISALDSFVVCVQNVDFWIPLQMY
jgi:hypothetical protein